MFAFICPSQEKTTMPPSLCWLKMNPASSLANLERGWELSYCTSARWYAWDEFQAADDSCPIVLMYTLYLGVCLVFFPSVFMDNLVPQDHQVL